MRPYQELSEGFMEKRNEIVNRFVKSPKNTKDFKNNLDTMLFNITIYLTSHKGKPEDIKNRSDTNPHIWTDNLNQIHTQYGALYNAYKQLTEEENIINRIETRAHLRALLFRFLTTLAIGACVMLVYYLSHKWNIPMPLSRTLTNGL